MHLTLFLSVWAVYAIPILHLIVFIFKGTMKNKKNRSLVGKNKQRKIYVEWVLTLTLKFFGFEFICKVSQGIYERKFYFFKDLFNRHIHFDVSKNCSTWKSKVFQHEFVTLDLKSKHNNTNFACQKLQFASFMQLTRNRAYRHTLTRLSFYTNLT